MLYDALLKAEGDRPRGIESTEVEMIRTSLCAVAALLWVGCSDSTTISGTDAGMDSGSSDSGTDSSVLDGGADLGLDAGSQDLGSDGSPADMNPPDASLPTSGSFHLNAAFTYDTSGGGGGAPSVRNHEFVMFLEALDTATATGFAGAFGGSDNVTFLQGTSRGALTLSGRFDIPFVDIGTSTCGRDGPVHYTSMSLTLSDNDSDGIVDITGSAEGMVDSFGGDVIWSTPFTAVITGQQEVDAPTLARLIKNGDVVNPVDTVSAWFTEPLRAGVTGSFESSAGNVPLAFSDSEAAMSASSHGVFPWGATMTLALTGAADFTDIGFASTPTTFSTIGDPGLFTEWDFEAGSIHAYTENDTRRADLTEFGFDSGYALYVPSRHYDSELSMVVPAGRATMRVAISDVTNILSFDVALVENDGETTGYFLGAVDVIIPSSGEHIRATIPTFESGTVVNNHTPFVTVSVLIDSAIFAGDPEVILDVQGDGLGCGFRPPAPRGLLVDNITMTAE